MIKNSIIDSNESISFKETFDLTGLPIIILHQNNKAYNFVFDSGSNVSHIHKYSDIEVDILNETDNVRGLSSSIETNICSAKLSYKDNILPFNYRYTDMTALISNIKEETGVNIVGIIGSDFMDEYNYCINYKDYLITRLK